MADQLDPALLEPIEKIARFIETGDKSLLSVFATKGVVIIENFAPHLFEGPEGVQLWAEKISSWQIPTGNLVLKHSFGPAQDLSIHDGVAFLSLPTHWQIFQNGESFQEDGGWAFVLVQENDAWRVRCYGWAVTLVED